jgi:hypothetical protein
VLFTVLSCNAGVGFTVPHTPKIVTPCLIFPAIIFSCSVLLIYTVPPLVYPAGITTQPATAEIVPPIAPLFVILPVSLPVEVWNFLPLNTSPTTASSSEVS